MSLGKAARRESALVRQFDLLRDHLYGLVDSAARCENIPQQDLHELAWFSSNVEAASSVLEDEVATTRPGLVGRVLAQTAEIALARLSEVAARWGRGGVDALNEVLEWTSPEETAAVAAHLPREHAYIECGLSTEISELGQNVRRFVRTEVAPVAQDIHVQGLDVPDEVIHGLGQMGAFGLSIPERYSGSKLDGDDSALLRMCVITEELSRGSLGAAGSLITRPEILVAALMEGGTTDQREEHLPRIASGDELVAVAVTEPGHGSDVANLQMRAEEVKGGWRLNGVKTWCTFAGKADVLLVLARTSNPPGRPHRGLSMFLVEKPRKSGKEFRFQANGGVLQGQAIATPGYRGMHSYEVSFESWFVPSSAVIGGREGVGRGFYLQMGAFETARLQTAARATGTMQAALDCATRYCNDRIVFGRAVRDWGLTESVLVDMQARCVASRAFTYGVARQLACTPARRRAAQAKHYSAQHAETVARQAQQLHGGYGYAEEYPISRIAADARVLSIFEGTNEVLALRVIAPSLLSDHPQED